MFAGKSSDVYQIILKGKYEWVHILRYKTGENVNETHYWLGLKNYSFFSFIDFVKDN